MMKSRLGRAFACAVGAAALLSIGLVSDASAETVEWRIATLAPTGSVWMKVLSRGAKEVEKQTEGRVKIKYYAGGVQGDEKDAVRKMGLGQLDGSALTSVGLALIDQSVRVLELPRLFKDVKELDYVRRKMWGKFRRRFKKKGYILGDPGDVGFIYVYSNKEIKSLGDLKALKLWRWGEDKIIKSMYKRLGLNGKSMGVPDVLPALNTGRINACYGSPVAMVALQWYTKVKYSTSVPLSYAIGSSVIRKEAWEKVSESDRKIIKKIFKTQSKKIRKAVRKDNKRAKKSIKRSVKEVKTPQALVDKFDEVSLKVWADGAGSVYPQKYLDKVIKLRDEYRAK